MDSQTFRSMSARRIAEGVNKGEFKAEEIARASIAEATRLDPKIKAFNTLLPDLALATARKVDARIQSGEKLPLAGVPIALATDCNPGTSPLPSPLATMNMACVLFGLTPEEALLGVTANAARALGLADRGRIAPGLKADLVIWDAERPGELAYPLGFNPLAAVIRNGALVRGSFA